MRGFAIAWLILVGPATAHADAIWCGTFADERHPVREAAIPAPPAVRVRVEHALVDGARDGRAGRRIDSALALEGCLLAGEVGRGAIWSLELIVSADGTVIDARVRGEPRGMRCLTDRVRSIRFPRGAQPRSVSARVIATAR